MDFDINATDDTVFRVNAFSSDDEEERRRRIIRPRPNDFEVWDEKDFFQRFRLSKRAVGNILEEIEDTIRFPTNRSIIKLL